MSKVVQKTASQMYTFLIHPPSCLPPPPKKKKIALITNFKNQDLDLI